MKRTLAGGRRDYKRGILVRKQPGCFLNLPADAVAMGERGEAPDERQEQHDGRGEQETVHTLSPLDTYPIDRE